MLESAKSTIEKVRKTIRRYGMIYPGEGVIVAVSGGPDSVCLVHILHHLSEELGARLVAAHFDHGLRPGEDESETELVRSLASSMGLSFETERSPSLKDHPASSLEEAARDARYAFLRRIRERHGAQRIALGHHLDDQAETVLMRLLRGSGPTGLSGIPPVREGGIMRPLIEIRRAEIEVYLKEHDLPSAIDSSNLHDRFLRNRIRRELIPLLLEYQPRLIEHLGETASTLREESTYLDALSDLWMEREMEVTPEGDISVPRAPFLDLPQALKNRVVRGILSRVKGDIRRIGRAHVLAVNDLASADKPQAGLNLPNRLTVSRGYDRLLFSLREQKRTRDFSYRLDAPGTVLIREIGRSLAVAEREHSPDLDVTESPWTAYLDADLVRFPLVIRNFRPGDRFIPLGMKGHKKIKDFFTDLKVPLHLRRTTPILCSVDTPMWVCGYRIDERFKVTATTRRVVMVKIQPS